IGVLRSLYRGAEENWRKFHRCHAATKQNRSSFSFWFCPTESAEFRLDHVAICPGALRFSVATGVSIVANGVSANLWRFFWGPIADLTLTARGWYLIGL